MIHISSDEIKQPSLHADTLGFTFVWQGHFLRGIYPESVNLAKSYFECGFIDEVVSKGIFPKTWISEFENEQFQHLGSVATNNGYSDWATTAIPADVKTMWYRFSRRDDDFCIGCSANGVGFIRCNWVVWVVQDLKVPMKTKVPRSFYVHFSWTLIKQKIN